MAGGKGDTPGGAGGSASTGVRTGHVSWAQAYL